MDEAACLIKFELHSAGSCGDVGGICLDEVWQKEFLVEVYVSNSVKKAA